jgi:hypothetical protein
MYQGQGIQSLGIACLLKLGSQLEDLGILLWSSVARVTALLGWGCGWEVVVIVLGIKFHSGVFGRHGERSMEFVKLAEGRCCWRARKKTVNFRVSNLGGAMTKVRFGGATNFGISESGKLCNAARKGACLLW